MNTSLDGAALGVHVSAEHVSSYSTPVHEHGTYSKHSSAKTMLMQLFDSDME